MHHHWFLQFKYSYANVPSKLIVEFYIIIKFMGKINVVKYKIVLLLTLLCTLI